MSDNPDSNNPRIAFMMADDYPWDLIREKQLPDVDFEVWSDCLEWDEDTLLEKLRGVTAAVSGRKTPHLPEGLIDDPGKFRTLIHCHGGLRGRISEEQIRSGITVTNWGTGDGTFSGVAEGALVLIYACLRQIPNLHSWALSNKQVDNRIYQNFPCTLRRAKIGLYGFGPIGRCMAPMLAPFEPDMAIYDPYAKDIPEGIKVCDSLEELFDHSDIVSIHCGLNEVTHKSVTGDLLDRLPQGGIIVNTARGKIIDEEALGERVHAGRILAGLDVICEESNWAGSPCAGSPNAIFSAHTAAKGKGCEPQLVGPKMLSGFVVDNIYAVLNGTPLKNVVTADEYVLKT